MEYAQGRSDNRYLFTGKEYDAESGVFYFGARYYDSKAGRWLARDPKEEFFSSSVYCGNNPMGFVDPNGKWMGEAGIANGGYALKFKVGYNSGEFTMGLGFGYGDGGFGSIDLRNLPSSEAHVKFSLSGSRDLTTGNTARDLGVEVKADAELRLFGNHNSSLTVGCENTVNAVYSNISYGERIEVVTDIQSMTQETLNKKVMPDIKAGGSIGAFSFIGGEIEAGVSSNFIKNLGELIQEKFKD